MWKLSESFGINFTILDKVKTSLCSEKSFLVSWYTWDEVKKWQCSNKYFPVSQCTNAIFTWLKKQSTKFDVMHS